MWLAIDSKPELGHSFKKSTEVNPAVCTQTVLVRRELGIPGSSSSPAAGSPASDSLIPFFIFKIRKATLTSAEVLVSVLQHKDPPCCFLLLGTMLIFNHLSSPKPNISNTFKFTLIEMEQFSYLWVKPDHRQQYWSFPLTTSSRIHVATYMYTKTFSPCFYWSFPCSYIPYPSYIRRHFLFFLSSSTYHVTKKKLTNRLPLCCLV